MTGSPYEMLKQAADRCGWTVDSQVSILLGYIENQDSDDAFGDYLEECIAEEASLELEGLP